MDQEPKEWTHAYAWWSLRQHPASGLLLCGWWIFAFDMLACVLMLPALALLKALYVAEEVRSGVLAVFLCALVPAYALWFGFQMAHEPGWWMRHGQH